MLSLIVLFSAGNSLNVQVTASALEEAHSTVDGPFAADADDAVSPAIPRASTKASNGLSPTLRRCSGFKISGDPSTHR